jgi:MoxR-like ATPase
MVPVSDEVARYVVRVVRATRFKSAEAPEIVRRYVNYGASVRAAQFIVLAAKARALARGHYHVDFEDVDAYVLPVLRHRVLLNFHAQSDRVEADEILRQMLTQMPRP